MAVRNKDGTIFTLRGPNPVMEKQTAWDPNQITTYNLNKDQPTTVSDHKNPYEEFTKQYNVKDLATELRLPQQVENIKPEEFVREVQEIKQTEIKQPIATQEPVVLYGDEKTSRIVRENQTKLICLPAIEEKREDDLYDTVYISYTYGERFVFDGIILEEDDFSILVWAVREIPPYSIIYPKTRSKRWWRIQTTKPKEGGFIMNGIISDVNPDLS